MWYFIAITDAILGLACAGDIGEIFPPSEEKWRDANSAIFLTEAISRLEKTGGELSFVDVTIVCELPKITPHRQNIRAAIAKRCNIALSRVSVKATTSEQLGFTGRGEGISVMATANACFMPHNQAS